MEDKKVIYLVMGSRGECDDWICFPLKAFYNKIDAKQYGRKFHKIVKIAKKYFGDWFYSKTEIILEQDADKFFIFKDKYEWLVEFNECYIKEIEIK